MEKSSVRYACNERFREGESQRRKVHSRILPVFSRTGKKEFDSEKNNQGAHEDNLQIIGRKRSRYSAVTIKRDIRLALLRSIPSEVCTSFPSS